MAAGFLPTRRSKSFCLVILFGVTFLLLMAVRVYRNDYSSYTTRGRTATATNEQHVDARMAQPAAPDVPRVLPKTPRPQPPLRGGVWGEACPGWNPPAAQDPPLSADARAEANLLIQTLKTRLELPNDVEKPTMNFSVSCEANSRNKDKYLKACTDYKCQHPLSKNVEERVEDILRSPELQLTAYERDAIDIFSQMFPVNDVIIVTAASSNHFGEAQKMFKSLHEVVYPVLKNFSVVFVDIGLTERERKMAENSCKCQVIKFPYEWFPAHVKVNNCYSFKPLSVLAAMKRARRLVVWQDSSVRWTSEFQHIFGRAERYGTQIIRYEGMARVPAHTLRPTFDYMKREVCAFTAFPEIEACAQVHLNDPVTLRLVLEPWAKCALERCCICPVSPGPVLPCTKPSPLHRCHRFDQSALTIVLGRLLNNDFLQFVMPNWHNNQPVLRKLGGDVLNNYFHL